ncbi:disulfide bond formation protein B [Candidatus Microgenomates bacterium]|nr:disulfide bond formation protein B [Candidatus Microgenomates bacterium]
MRLKVLSYIGWVQAAGAMSGSLFFSEIWRLPPCLLCWYQRILMYPLVVIIAVGILRKDKDLPFYALPLSVGGMVIAFYHMLLYWGVLPESVAPCILGISCTTKFFEWYGFVTIPFLSFLAFFVITTCMVLVLRGNRKN